MENIENTNEIKEEDNQQVPETKSEESSEKIQIKQEKEAENKDLEKKRKKEEKLRIKEQKKQARKEKKLRKKQEKKAKLVEKKEKKSEKPIKIKESKNKSKFLSSKWYDKNYKLFFFISLAILIASIAVIGYQYAATGEIMKRDVSLTGGTVLTIYTEQEVNLDEFSLSLERDLGESVIIKSITDVSSGKRIGISIESRAESELLKTQVEERLSIELTEENTSTETISSNLSQSFFRELITAVLLAFVFMIIVVFIIFKKIVPCVAVILAAITDVIAALAIANIFGISMSTAGIAALLMLIGYSIDTDIMLTTKVIKRRDLGLNQRIKGAFKTGVMMTITSFIAVFVAYFLVSSGVLKQIFFILAAGLFIDLFTTWLGNASILKWNFERKNKKLNV